MSVPDKDRKPVIPIKQPDRTRLFLGEQQAAVFSADDPVSVVRALPHELPLGAGNNHSWDPSNRHFFRRRRLRERPLLCEGMRTKRQSHDHQRGSVQ
jgi:hypothetical protein